VHIRLEYYDHLRLEKGEMKVGRESAREKGGTQENRTRHSVTEVVFKYSDLCTVSTDVRSTHALNLDTKTYI